MVQFIKPCESRKSFRWKDDGGRVKWAEIKDYATAAAQHPIVVVSLQNPRIITSERRVMVVSYIEWDLGIFHRQDTQQDGFLIPLHGINSSISWIATPISQSHQLVKVLSWEIGLSDESGMGRRRRARVRRGVGSK